MVSTAMLKLPLVLLAGFACAESLEPAPESGTLAPPPEPTSFVPGKPAHEPVSQRWHFLTPTVDYVELRNRDWETSNLAANSPYYSAALFRFIGTGINITGNSNSGIDKLSLLVNNTDPEVFGAKGEKIQLENGRIAGVITGLKYGWWELGYRGNNGTTFYHATAIGQPGVSLGKSREITKAPHVQFEGQWENGRTNSTGSSVTFCPPLRTGLLEITANQPPVPFGAFRVTIDPHPSVGPSMQDYYPHLQPTDIQFTIAHVNVPIYSTVLDPMTRSCVKIEYIGDGTKPFVAHNVAYHTSRLIFQNLPPNISPEAFKSKLTEPKTLQSVVVTDTKVVAKRRFAFVGFRTDEDAAKVKEWFNGSFVFGGGKVKVEFVSEEPLAPKAKRQKTDKHDKKAEDVTTEEAGPSKQYKEFMDVMKGTDGATAESSTTAQAKASKKGKEKATPEPEVIPADDEDDDDAAWLAKRKAALDGDEDESDEPNVDPEDAMILSTGRLFVRNLAFVATADDIKAHFEKFGPIVDVHMPVSHSTGEPLGTAFVLFRDPNNALSARQSLDKTTFQGRLLHVLPGRARPGQENASGVAGIIDGKVLGKATEARGEVKQRQDEKRKADSARGVNWATLYMNADAVAASVAKRMGVSKSELLDGSDDMSPAVKLALAETQVIAETKAYFENEGIVLDSLQPRVPRSQTTILVKNIPFGTTITQLQDLFAPHGDLKRVLLPPAGTIGVVEFVNNMDAGRAFKALAYRRLGNSVLYLEKGPVGMFKDPNAISTPAAKAAEERAKLTEKVAEAEATLRDKPDESDEAGATLFLKNLAWATTNETLASVLSSLPGYSFSRVQTKPDPKRPGARLSMGYGFVGFKTKKEAQAALAGLEGFKIDGHAIEAKFAQRGQDEVEKEHKTKSEEGKTKGTKLLVKNLPFEATKKDVRALFSAYGTLKSLRVPRKSTMSATGAQSTRGFAFLEFTTHAEAQRAMDALKHTHLLGRHLVTEWAKDEDSVDVDALREKVSRDSKKGELGGRKRKLDLTGRGGIDENDGLDL